MHIPDQESRGHIVPSRVYILVGAALLVLTVLTVGASYVDWGVTIGGGFMTNVIIAMIIATAKASLVLLIFMHLKWEDRLIAGFGLVYPIILFTILVSFVSIDTFLRVIPEPAPQMLEQQKDAGKPTSQQTRSAPLTTVAER